MRCATWNVWWRFGADWQARQRRIVSTLRALDPDIVGLQECWAADGRTQAEAVAGALGMHAAFAAPSLPPPPDPPERPDQAGVELGLGLVSRWPVVAVGHDDLPARGRPSAPVVLRATVGHPSGPLHVLVAATEWEPARAGDHLAQTRRLAQLAAEPGLDGPLPVVLLADLNAGPGDRELEPLLEVMVDTWAAAGGAADARTLRSEHPDAPLEADKQLDRRIDHILARPGRAG